MRVDLGSSKSGHKKVVSPKYMFGCLLFCLFLATFSFRHWTSYLTLIVACPDVAFKRVYLDTTVIGDHLILSHFNIVYIIQYKHYYDLM